MRKDAKENQALVSLEYLRYYAEHGKAPTLLQIAEETGLTRQTVYKHFAAMDFKELFAPYKTHFPKIMQSIVEQAEANNIKAAKLYLDALMGKEPEKVVEMPKIEVVVKIDKVDGV